MTASDLTPNDELTVAVRKKVAVLKLRDQHREVANRTRPEGLGCGHKISPRPSLDDYDNR